MKGGRNMVIQYPGREAVPDRVESFPLGIDRSRSHIHKQQLTQNVVVGPTAVGVLLPSFSASGFSCTYTCSLILWLCRCLEHTYTLLSLSRDSFQLDC